MAKVAKAEKKQSAIEKAKARLKKMSQKGGKEFPFNYLTIETDTSVVVRIFPNWKGEEEGDFYRHLQIHRNVGKDKKTEVCLRSVTDAKGDALKCYICDKRDSLKEKYMPIVKKNKEEGIKLLKKHVDPLKPKDQFIMNAVRLTKNGPVQTFGDNAGKPADKPEVFTPGPQVMEQILALFVEEEADICGDFFDPKNRYDFLIKKKKTGPHDYDVEYTVMPTRKYVDVDTDDLAKALIDLDENGIGQALTPAQLKARFLNEEESEEDEDLEEEESDDDVTDDDEDVGDGGDEDDDEEEKPAKKKGKKASDDDEDEDGDEDDASDESDDDDDSSDDEDEDEDDDEEEKPAKKKGKKASDEDEDEDESEDDDDSDDDEAEEDEVDDDDDDSSDDEDEDDDEEEKPAKKKGKKASDEDEDEDESEDDDEADDSDEDEDDDEEEKPAKKAKKAPAKGKVSPKAATKRGKR